MMAYNGPASRILLVEDSPAQRFVLRHILEQLGHDVTAVADAETALTLDCGFSAVVTDLTLPGIGGAALIGALRTKWAAAVTMIALSASPCAVAGADVVLPKPVTAQQLARAVAGCAQSDPVVTKTVLDPRPIVALHQDLGRDQAMGLIRRFIAEADRVCAQTAPDNMALHHLAGAAAMFGAIALQAAALAGDAMQEWPETRAAVLHLTGQMV